MNTDSGCSATDMVTITVENENCGEVFVPNAFSPNSDGVNDILYVRGKCISSMDFYIFDRWGNKVFESHSPSRGWDGRYNGLPMNTATFSYYLDALLIDGTTITKRGNVTLVR